MGTVYLIGDSLNEGVYKIGVTRGSVENRIKKLQTGSPGELYLVNSFQSEHPFILEKMLHTKYSGNSTVGEWYELGDSEVIGFIETCEKFQKSIDALNDNYFFKKKYNKTNDFEYE